MNERINFILTGILFNINALNLYMTRTDFPKSILSNNKAIINIVDFAKTCFEETNINITVSRYQDLISQKLNIPRSDVKTSDKSEIYLEIYNTCYKLYKKEDKETFVDKWKAELKWCIEDYIIRKRLEISREEHQMAKESCFPQLCREECEIKKHCQYALKNKMTKLQYIQTWREAEDQRLRNLLKDKQRVSEHKYHANIEDRLRRYDLKHKLRTENPGKVLGVPFSIPTLNTWTDGWMKGRAYCFAARTGQGKSAIALQEALYAWANSMYNILFINIEMQITELEERMDANRTGYSFDKILKGKWDDDEEYQAFRKTVQENPRENEFVILDTPTLTLGGMSYYIRQHANKWGENFIVIVDNLNRMTYPTGKINEAANSIVLEFHSCIKEFNIAGALLCQLNREAENETRIQSKHFRDADQIGDHLDATFAVLPFGQRRKKLVVVKGRSFFGNHVILNNQLDKMRLIEEDTKINESAFDEDEEFFR